jgi:hypothetical protein
MYRILWGDLYGMPRPNSTRTQERTTDADSYFDRGGAGPDDRALASPENNPRTYFTPMNTAQQGGGLLSAARKRIQSLTNLY